MPGIGRVPGDDENRLLLDRLGRLDLGADGGKQEVRLRLYRLQGVRQKHLKAFATLEPMLLVLEVLRQLQMRDRVGGDQVFEPEKVLQQVLTHYWVSAPLTRPADVFEDPLKDFQQKSTGAAGEVEHGHALVVGEAIADAEALFQDIIDRTDDEIHDRRGRIVDAPALAHGRVVGLQVVLVEVDEGVPLEQAVLLLVGGAHLAADRLALPERQVLLNGRQVQSIHDGQHLLDHPAHIAVFLFVELRQEVDQLADEAEGPRHVLPRVVQRNDFRVGVEAREKEAVGQHLRKRIRELLQRQLVEHLIAEDLKQPVQPALRVLPLLAHQLLAQIVAQQLAAGSQRQRQLLRAVDVRRRRRKERLQQLADGRDPVLAQPKLRVLEVGQVAQRLALDAVLVDPDEVEIVGNNDVLREFLVPLDLVGFQHLIEVLAYRLVLDVAEDEALAGDLEVRGSLFGNALGLMVNANALRSVTGDRFQQGLKRSTIRVLRLLIQRRPPESLQIAIEAILDCHLMRSRTMSSGGFSSERT